MPRDARLYLEDIVEACQKVLEYTAGFDERSFLADGKTIDATIRNLEVIGEAAKRVPADVRDAISGVSWNRISGLRDVLIHDYFGVDRQIVWDIVATKVRPLLDAVRDYLST